MVHSVNAYVREIFLFSTCVFDFSCFCRSGAVHAVEAKDYIAFVSVVKVVMLPLLAWPLPACFHQNLDYAAKTGKVKYSGTEKSISLGSDVEYMISGKCLIGEIILWYGTTPVNNKK